jgi:hypothetical protein
MIDVLHSQVQLMLMPFPIAAVFRATIDENSQQPSPLDVIWVCGEPDN